MQLTEKMLSMLDKQGPFCYWVKLLVKMKKMCKRIFILEKRSNGFSEVLLWNKARILEKASLYKYLSL